jgi:hypothetical protein
MASDMEQYVGRELLVRLFMDALSSTTSPQKLFVPFVKQVNTNRKRKTLFKCKLSFCDDEK